MLRLERVAGAPDAIAFDLEVLLVDIQLRKVHEGLLQRAIELRVRVADHVRASGPM